MAKPARILVTGFGPFPGMPENVSGRLARELAIGTLGETLGGRIEAHALPTVWAEVARLAPALLEATRPRLVLHLGVSRRARGFRIERRAQNLAEPKLDARGSFPFSATVLDGGPSAFATRLSAPRIARYLRSHGLPATASSSCGTYLCNFLYYLSLDWAARQAMSCDVCFVHVPPAPSDGGPLSEEELARGTALVLHYLVSHAEELDNRGEERTLRAPMAAASG